jgi:hypothetical protein
MNETKKNQIVEFYQNIDEGYAHLIIWKAAEKFDTTYQQAEYIYDNLYSYATPKSPAADCHYCGMPATTRDYFGAPTCQECGG